MIAYKVCPNCDSIYRDTFCFNCGKLIDVDKEVAADTNVKQSRNSKQEESIFDKIGDPSEFLDFNLNDKSKKGEYIILGILLVLTFGISYLYYYFLIAKKIDKFFSPIQVASDIANNVESLSLGKDSQNVDKDVAGVSTIPLKIDLKEGNFAKMDLFNFLPKEKNLSLYLFDLPTVYKKYVSEQKYKDTLSDFDIKEDDLTVYLSNNFIISFQEDNLDTWGYISEVLDKDFVKKKVDTYQAKIDAIDKASKQKVKSKNIPTVKNKMYVKLVELSIDGSSEKKTYILASNDAEYLDLLKENSEGNVSNLAKDALFSKSKDEVVTSGFMFVYKKDSKDSWEKLADHIASKHDFVGLNKILQNFTKNAVVFYSKDEKVKVNESKD